MSPLRHKFRVFTIEPTMNQCEEKVKQQEFSLAPIDLDEAIVNLEANTARGKQFMHCGILI